MHDYKNWIFLSVNFLPATSVICLLSLIFRDIFRFNIILLKTNNACIQVYHPSKWTVRWWYFKNTLDLKWHFTDQSGWMLKGISWHPGRNPGLALVVWVGRQCHVSLSFTSIFLIFPFPVQPWVRGSYWRTLLIPKGGRYTCCVCFGPDETTWVGLMKEECRLWSWEIRAWDLICHCLLVWPDASQRISVSHCSWVKW